MKLSPAEAMAGGPAEDEGTLEGRIRIARLAADSPHLLGLVRWAVAQWGHHDPGRRLDQAVAEFRTQCGEAGLPSVFVALSGDTPVGMASLVDDDMHDRPLLNPWLASVYVCPDWRGQGIASCLVRRVEREASEHGIATLHLFTPDRQALYRRLGWCVVKERDYRGERVTIMRRVLGESA